MVDNFTTYSLQRNSKRNHFQCLPQVRSLFLRRSNSSKVEMITIVFLSVVCKILYHQIYVYTWYFNLFITTVRKRQLSSSFKSLCTPFSAKRRAGTRFFKEHFIQWPMASNSLKQHEVLAGRCGRNSQIFIKVAKEKNKFK